MDRPLVAAVCTILLISTSAFGQAGDREGHDMVEVWRDMDVPPAPVVEPADALDTFRLAPGFRLELVAAEPLVEDPVAMTFDARGRMWVVEMRGFMPNVDGEGEDEPVGRIVVLEDTNGDGTMDESTVFLDELVMPRAVAIVEDGVLVAEPPNLWFCRDTTGDGKADEKVSVLDYAQQGPVEHTDNRLMHGLDNWIYNAKSSIRFRFADGEISELDDDTHFRGQWGITQDNYGRLLHNHNSHYLFADFFTDDYLRRNPNWGYEHGLSERIADTREVWPIRINPGVNRGYMDGQLREDGRLRRITAISDLVVYRGDQFGDDYVGDAFVPEPAGNAVAHFRLHEDGVTLEAEHVTYDDPEWDRREFIASTDERFRPVSIYNAPDGSVYIVDMYRGILQHRVYVTTYLRNYILEQGLDKPLGLGRIYRVVRDDREIRREAPDLANASTAELIAYLSHDNGWHRDTAQRLLVERNDEDAVRGLRSLAQNGRNPLGRLHGLWVLHGMGALDLATVNAAASDTHPQVRIAALRTAESLLEGRHASRARQRLLPHLLRMSEDDDHAVRVQAAFSLGAFVGEDDQAKAAMAKMLSAEPGDRYIRQAIISGLHGRELAMLDRLLDDEAWAEQASGRSAVLRDLADTTFRAGRAVEVTRLIETAANETGWRRAAVLDGMTRAADDRRNPVELPGEPEALLALAADDDDATREAAAELAEGLDWPDDAEMAEGEAVAELTAEQEAMRERGQTMYMGMCMACHQLHGQGQRGMAPSIIDSEYVLGEPEKLAAIVLDGVSGVSDEQQWNMVMPGMRGNLDDEVIAALMTYLRRAWEHEASPVEPELVERVRTATEGRNTPWTKDELEALDTR